MLHQIVYHILCIRSRPYKSLVYPCEFKKVESNIASVMIYLPALSLSTILCLLQFPTLVISNIASFIIVM